MDTWDSEISDASLLSALQSHGFSKPTSIQRQAIPAGVSHRQDLIIASKTGSGKTLCFLLPIVVRVEKNGIPQALILSPTRELALQIDKHLQMLNTKKFNSVCIIGGMSDKKQIRILEKQKPEIIIATPGRLWELISSNPHLRQIYKINFLVIDEADRMIEVGHFREVYQILDFIYNPNNHPDDQTTVKKGQYEDLNFGYDLALDESFLYVKDDDDNVFDIFQENPELVEPKAPEEKVANKKRQTFLVSATLTMAEPARLTGKQRRKKKRPEESRLDKLLKRIQFNGKPRTIDLTQEETLPNELTEFKINCRDEEKDFFVYYFLCNYPGSTIVFVNSVSCCRKLTSLLKALEFNVQGIDGKLQQRQRLKRLDRFSAYTSGILIATDVAARGLDMADIEHVIHYQFPRTSEIYVHRCGRTARIFKSGASMALIGETDVTNVHLAEKHLQRKISKTTWDLVKLTSYIDKVKAARELAGFELKSTRDRRSEEWLENAAEAAGVDAPVAKQKVTKRERRERRKEIFKKLKSQGPPRIGSFVITPDMFKSYSEKADQGPRKKSKFDK